MVTIEKDKKSLGLINNTTPVMAICLNHPDFQKLLMSFQAWHHHDPEVNINSLSSKVEGFSKVMGSDSLGTKILGSENNKTHIWIISVDDRKYVFFLSLRGLYIESVKDLEESKVVSDLKEIQKKFKFKPFEYKTT